MSVLLAAGSGALLVCAAWETFGALLRLPLLDLLGRVLGPARRAGREGQPAMRPPTQAHKPRRQGET